MLMLMHIEKVTAKAGKKPTDMPIGWLDDGLAFVIRDKEKLVQEWLPVFFKQGKFASFTRKVRLSGQNAVIFVQRSKRCHSWFIFGSCIVGVSVRFSPEIKHKRARTRYLDTNTIREVA